MTFRPWEAFEDELLWRHGKDNKMLLALLPHRTLEAIRTRKKWLKVPCRIARRWSADEDGWIIRLHPDYPALALALPDRTLAAIQIRAGSLGLTTGADIWLGSELVLIRKDQGKSTAKELQQQLGRHTKRSIHFQRVALGISSVSRRRLPRSGLNADVANYASDIGMSIRELGRRLGATTNGKPLDDYQCLSGRPTQQKLASAVEVLGGELYAEWED